MLTETQKTSLYEVYQPKVERYFRFKVNDADLAEELTAEVFLKVYEKLDTYDETKAALSTWIFTVARNTMTDYFRTRRVTSEIPEDLAEDSSVEEEVCSGMMLDKLAGALETLEERERDLIILRYYEGEKLTDIAQKLGISYAYVKILHNKALSKLKKCF